jgi:hypothetical protein
MSGMYIEVVEAYRVDIVVRERSCRQVMPSHWTGTIDSKSGTHIPRPSYFQGFVEQEGKGRGGHTYSLPKKDTTKTWASGGDIGSIDTYSERARKWRKKPSRRSSKPRDTCTRCQSEKGERMSVPSQPWTRHHTLCSIYWLLPRYGPCLSNISDLNSSLQR